MLLTQRLQTIQSSVFSNKSPLDNFFPEVFVEPFEPQQYFGYYATWRDDPRNSIIIHYQTTEDNVGLEYKRASDRQWIEQPPTATKDYFDTDMSIKWFELNNLEADTIYDFRIKGTDDHLRFQTMPDNLSEMRVALTSDTTHAKEYMVQFMSQGALREFDPDVLVITGDVAHADGEAENWKGFWEAWFEVGNVNARGHIIPIVAQLGNHDGIKVEGYIQLYEKFGSNADQARQFHNFFPLPDIGYHTLDAGNYFSLIGLNTGHTAKIEGAQTEWLEQKLQERHDGRWVIPCMHISPYPTRYLYDNEYCIAIRDYWTPLLTQYDIKVAHTGHNHVFGVTKPVTGEILDPNGTIYIGQGYSFGTWGGELTADPNEWYFDVTKAVNHEPENARSFNAITLTQNQMLVESIAMNGTRIYSKTFNK